MPTTYKGNAEVQVSTKGVPIPPVVLLKKRQSQALIEVEKLRRAIVDVRCTMSEEEILKAASVVANYVEKRDWIKANPNDGDVDVRTVL